MKRLKVSSAIIGAAIWVGLAISLLCLELFGYQIGIIVNNYNLVLFVSIVFMALYFDPFMNKIPKDDLKIKRRFRALMMFITGIVSFFGALSFVTLFDSELVFSFRGILFIINGMIATYILYDVIVGTKDNRAETV